MVEKNYVCRLCGEPLGSCVHADRNRLGWLRINILSKFGSKGAPSCGLYESTEKGLEPSSSKLVTFGGVDGVYIAPGTGPSLFPFSLLYKLIPWRLPKNPRNYKRHQEKHGSGK